MGLQKDLAQELLRCRSATEVLAHIEEHAVRYDCGAGSVALHSLAALARPTGADEVVVVVVAGAVAATAELWLAPLARCDCWAGLVAGWPAPHPPHTAFTPPSRSPGTPGRRDAGGRPPGDAARDTAGGRVRARRARAGCAAMGARDPRAARLAAAASVPRAPSGGDGPSEQNNINLVLHSFHAAGPALVCAVPPPDRDPSRT